MLLAQQQVKDSVTTNQIRILTCPRAVSGKYPTFRYMADVALRNEQHQVIGSVETVNVVTVNSGKAAVQKVVTNAMGAAWVVLSHWVPQDCDEF